MVEQYNLQPDEDWSEDSEEEERKARGLEGTGGGAIRSATFVEQEQQKQGNYSVSYCTFATRSGLKKSYLNFLFEIRHH